jgi:hypothetical protein
VVPEHVAIFRTRRATEEPPFAPKLRMRSLLFISFGLIPPLC